MKMRSVLLVDAEAFTDSQTLNVPINIVDPISSIDIIIKMTNGAAMTEDSVVKIHDDFTKIELVDGADVLASASMEEWQALNAFEKGKMPYQLLTLEDNGVQREACQINFGMKLNDLKHYLDPSKYTNPVLKITNVMTAAAATAWAAAGHTITVIANVIEEGAQAYEGFLSFKSMYSYAAVDAAVETIDMPVDDPYRLILIQAFKTGKRPEENIEIVKLTCDADRFVPVNMKVIDLQIQNYDMFGVFYQKLVKRMKAAGDICYSDLFFNCSASVAGGTTLYNPNITSIDEDQIVAETHAQT